MDLEGNKKETKTTEAGGGADRMYRNEKHGKRK